MSNRIFFLSRFKVPEGSRNTTNTVPGARSRLTSPLPACVALFFCGATLMAACSSGDDSSGDSPLDPSAGGVAGAMIAGSGGLPSMTTGAGGYVAGVGGSMGGAAPGAGGMMISAGGMVVGLGGAVGAGGMDLGAGGLVTGAAGMMLGSGGTMLGDGGLMGMGGDMPPSMDLGQGDGKDVITIGDSYMLLLVTGIQVSLERISGRDYRNYAVPGTVIDQILQQYATASQADSDIKTVVMTGGGNDILLNSCTGEACKPIVDTVSMKMANFLPRLAQGGVEDVILVGYGYPANEGKHWSLEYSREVSKEACKKDSKPRCHFIYDDLRDELSADGIHPTEAGYDRLGQMVWDLMQAEGMRR